MHCCWLALICWFFFFKQKTAYERRISDWSSDVCSSDLTIAQRRLDRKAEQIEPRRKSLLARQAGVLHRHHRRVGRKTGGDQARRDFGGGGAAHVDGKRDRKSVV